MTAKPPHVGHMADHPTKPTEKWATFQAEVAKAATREAAARDARDRERVDGSGYSRTDRGEPAKGA